MHEQRQAHERLTDILGSFQRGMLVTQGADGLLHGRPMTIAGRTPKPTLWFLSTLSTRVIDDLSNHARATVVFQDASRFLSLCGYAAVTTARPKIEAIWSSGFETWFPLGLDDPDLCAIYFEPSEGEYWDHSGLEAVRYAFSAVKAAFKDEPPEGVTPTEHARVSL